MNPFERRRKRLPKVVRRKLGREFAYGQYHDWLIEIDDRLRGKAELIILIHEMLHHLMPQATEHQVIEWSNELAALLWREGYRYTDNEQGIPD